MTKVVYRSGSPLRNPGQLFSDLAHNLLGSRELAWRLVVRNISARYRQTALGYFWAVFPPLATAAIWLLLARSNVVNVQVSEVPYPVFLIVGTLLWQSFVDGIQIPIRVVSESRQMLAKINFPREALPITAFAECIFNSVIRLLVLAAVLVYFQFVPASTFWLVLPGLLTIILLGLVIGMLLSPFSLLYDDVSNSLTLILQIWLYATPVIYAPSRDGILGVLSYYNPVSPILIQTRDWLLTGSTEFQSGALLVTITATLSLFVVLLIYRIALPRAIERISS